MEGEGWCGEHGGEGEGMSGGGCEDVHVCESTSGVCGYLLKLYSPSIVQASYPSPRVWTYRPGPAHDSPLAATRRFHPKPHPPNTSQTSGSSGGLSRAGKVGEFWSHSEIPCSLFRSDACSTACWE